MKISETFVSFQGEINVGRLAFFIRASKCNLQCKYCDTKYAWDEYVDIPVDKLVEQAIHFPRVVITGGEPFVQREELAQLIIKLKKEKPSIAIEIETNGTIRPLIIGKFDIQYNVSLKLKNSGNTYSERIKPKIANWFNGMGAYFKFVVQNEDDLDEVNMIVNDIGIKKEQVFLMPLGAETQDQLERMEKVIELAKFYGYNFTPRFHTLLWGNKKGV